MSIALPAKPAQSHSPEPEEGRTAILLVEDDDADARLVTRSLTPYARRSTVARATSLREARAWLHRNACDVVLLDLSLPDSFGLETVTRLHADAPSLPLVVLTGYDDEDFALEILAHGAQDYLVKGQTDGPLMWRAVQHAMARKRLEEELRLSEERLQGIIGLAQDAILTTDENLNITLFNRAAESLFGYDADDILGRPLSLLIPERFRPDHEVHIAGFAVSEMQAQVMTNRREVQGLTADGREFPAEVSIAKLHHARGLLFTAVIRDVSERMRVESELRRMATTDPLTGLNNRRRFMELAEVEMARLRRYGRPVSVLMLDIDRFKAINDTHGHAVGDRALVRLAEVCRAELRDTDHVGRVGGEEFAIILPETPLESATEVAERLRHRLSMADVALQPGGHSGGQSSGGTLRMTVSIGVAICGDEDASIERALGRADRALYEAKSLGRNRVVVSDGYPGPVFATASIPTSIAS
ncbi:diguanylate cyclase [Azospirillum sp. INR13]|uniref:GGDEF domain-containing response regulator n=1 Tax=Azospirillum sp. INR13 TaxID=2596919 RepID=UPI00189243A9|nr:diguanylate cyclase [Azospirillum sp. INR13]MBF5095341.1 diguanylate cyclase [Azospirillum sp. INR13]